MEFLKVYQNAYALMDEPVIEGNCGLLCNFHCCREEAEDGDKMGIYLLPMEYEAMIQGLPLEETLTISLHSARDYEMPRGITHLYFIYCQEASGCLRNHRPIQCRTYPYEPHLEEGRLSLVILKDQIHRCPLLDREDTWRPEFTKGVYEGWVQLLTLPSVKTLVEYDSRNRRAEDFRHVFSG